MSNAGLFGQDALDRGMTTQLEHGTADVGTDVVSTTAEQARQSIDDLVRNARRYRGSAEYEQDVEVVRVDDQVAELAVGK